jgi:hypothetical protein
MSTHSFENQKQIIVRVLSLPFAYGKRQTAILSKDLFAFSAIYSIHTLLKHEFKQLLVKLNPDS